LTTNFEAGILVEGGDLAGFYAAAFWEVWQRADPLSALWVNEQVLALDAAAAAARAWR
jgi:phosphatidylserine/phosphatidylglycerophosphate/cardiolipin synthase-like enzyme